MKRFLVLAACFATVSCEAPRSQETQTAGLLVLEGLPDEDPQVKFELKLAKSARTWTQTEPGGASNVFTTKSGPFAIVPPNIISLQKPGGTIVGQLRGITINSSVGSRGRGLSAEKGVNFGWTVKSSN